MRTAIVGFLILLATGLVIAVGFSAFIVPQTHRALVLQFGEPVRTIDNPGLYWRLPFVQTVVQFDRRILDLQTEEQEVIAADQKRIIVDAFARYRISDPLAFYRAFRNELAARQRLTAIVDSTIRSVLGRATFIDLVRNQREGLMKQTLAFVNNDVRGFGVDVVDVRIRRADLPEANSQAIFRRMQTERQREAAELRAQGAEQAQRIRSTADKEVTVVTANANRDGERIRGEGDAERNRIYADAFGRDRDFFAFYRSMQAYEESLKGSHTRIVVSPSSEFFRYFNEPMSAAPGSVRTPSPAGQTGSSAAAATPSVR